MLKQFKQKKRPGRKLNGSLNKKKTIPDKKEDKKQDSDSSASDVSDSDDSEYEELLISSIVNKTKIEDKEEVKPEVKPEVKKEAPEVKKEKKEQLLPPPLPLERQQTKPIDIPKPKKKSKKIIIKKYYQRKEPKTTPVVTPAPQQVKLNYLGLPMTGDYDTNSTRKQMTNKIFQW